MTKRNLRTCTVMVFTDGTRSVHAVMIGTMTKHGTFKPINKIARIEVVGKPNYRAMTARYATINAPAVDWQM